MFFDTASRRRPVMASSRATMMTTIQAPTFTGASGFRCVLSTKATNAEQVMILSASGSIKMPKLVMSLRARAMRPSRKSVTPARQKKISASVSLKANLENIAQRKTTVSPKRETVSLLGRFTKLDLWIYGLLDYWIVGSAILIHPSIHLSINPGFFGSRAELVEHL